MPEHVPNLFGLDDDEVMYSDLDSCAEAKWDDGHEPPLTIYEWSAKPLRSFIRSDNVIDRVIEYDCEEYLDDYGDVAAHLEKRAQDPFVIAAFDDALDLLFAKTAWRWADQKLYRWTVSWDPEVDPPEFTYEREEL